MAPSLAPQHLSSQCASKGKAKFALAAFGGWPQLVFVGFSVCLSRVGGKRGLASKVWVVLSHASMGKAFGKIWASITS